MRPRHRGRFHHLRAHMHRGLDGATLYRALAEAERDPVRKELFLQLAQAEGAYAEEWRQKLGEAGIAPETFRPSLRTRFLGRLAHHFGPRFVLPTVVAGELAETARDADEADAPTEALERESAAVLAVVADVESGGARRGTSGNDLRAAVLGANDGLASNFCLMMGVAGAGMTTHTVVLSGLAGLVAGACSMALGEWLSVSNARELAVKQLAQTRTEFERSPQALGRRLALIFQAKGIPRDDAERVAEQLMRSGPAAVETLAREELGIDPGELGGNPWSAAGFSFGLFALGAIVPVIPVAALRGAAGIPVCIAASATALAAIGALTSLFNGRSLTFSALRQLLFGVAAAGVTFGVGTLLRVSVL